MQKRMEEYKMIYYYCDGSYREKFNIVGCGIIRSERDTIEKIFRSTTENEWFQFYEAFAVYQTLLYIEEKQEKEVTIYNDDIALIRVICNRKETDTKISEKLLLQIQPIFRKIEELEENGYHITVQHKKDKDTPLMRITHNLSRSYLSDENIRKKQETSQDREIKQTPLTNEEKEVLRNKLLQVEKSETLDIKTLLSSHHIYFEKISKKKWCALNENNKPLYVNKNLPNLIYTVTKEILAHKKEVKIKDSSKLLFASAVRSYAAQLHYPKIYNEMGKWDEENRIQFIS